jgi:CheY-like chemotaxis protein
MPRIFGVDDQQDVRAMICMVLRLNRFEVTEAESAKAGLKAFAAALMPPLSTSSWRVSAAST